MEITSVKFLEPQNKEGAIKQYVSICLDEKLIIRSLRIIETNAGKLFLSFPSRKIENGDRIFSSYPIVESFRQYIETKVLEEYAKQLVDKEIVAEKIILS